MPTPTPPLHGRRRRRGGRHRRRRAAAAADDANADPTVAAAVAAAALDVAAVERPTANRALATALARALWKSAPDRTSAGRLWTRVVTRTDEILVVAERLVPALDALGRQLATAVGVRAEAATIVSPA